MQKHPITRRQNNPRSYGSPPMRRRPGKALPVHSVTVLTRGLVMLPRLQILGGMARGPHHRHPLTIHTNELPRPHLLSIPTTLELPLPPLHICLVIIRGRRLRLRHICSIIIRGLPLQLRRIFTVTTTELLHPHLLSIPTTLELPHQLHHI
jgi:hypothetical protein